MNAKEYVKNVLVTEATDFNAIRARLDERNLRMMHACAGISSEISEIIMVSDKYQAGRHTGKELDRVNLMEEISDVLWYCGIAADCLNAVEEIMESSTLAQESVLTHDGDLDDRIAAFVSCAAFFSGELVDKAIKKYVLYGKVFDAKPLIECLRQIHLNCESLLQSTGYTIEQARERNIEKLKARYGDKFTEAAALERNLEAERQILEKK